MDRAVIKPMSRDAIDSLLKSLAKQVFISPAVLSKIRCEEMQHPARIFPILA
jgi:hypothetical protein